MTGAGGPPARRLIPIAVLAAGLIAFFVFDLQSLLSLETLREHRAALTAFVARWGVAAGLVYVGVYALVVAFSIPGGALLTVIGGFLFGPYLTFVYVVIGATAGATALFCAARYAFADYLRARAGPWLEPIRRGFVENGMSYMLILRLVPLFPFWLVNLVPAFLGVPMRVYVLATLFGIMPGVIVYASLGDGLGAVLERGAEIDLGVVFEPKVLLPLIGLALLASLPVVYRHWKRGKR